ncbi:FecR domain-containing protein [Chitinophaga sp. MM2321]|uniref:FecR family protein n=1 Tax=Chitinophaga sp. MM2321 TaxID=3137178 RepID=UPI0032D57734
MQGERMAYLLGRYYDKTCTAAEKAEILANISKGEQDDLVKEVLEKLLAGHVADQTLDEGSADELFARIRQSAVSEEAVQETPVHRLYPRLRRWGAAAAVLLLLGAGAYFLRNRSAQPEAAYAEASHIVPGSNKAVLTLADGSVMNLDSAGNQVIQQGPMAILQHKGQLQYMAQGTETTTGFNTLSTPRGGQFQLTLSDGTRVWLNSASSLKYPTAFHGKERVVELNGQGYFEIAKNAGQPFRVKVNNGLEVQVLGTHFDIMAYPDEDAIKTTLLEGIVRVTQGSVEQMLKPGQQAVATTAMQHISVKETDVNKVIAWKNGLFIFNNVELGAILREIARWYDVEIVYQTPPNKDLYGGGMSRTKSLSEVLRFLEAGGTNHFKIEGQKVIVLP